MDDLTCFLVGSGFLGRFLGRCGDTCSRGLRTGAYITLDRFPWSLRKCRALLLRSNDCLTFSEVVEESRERLLETIHAFGAALRRSAHSCLARFNGTRNDRLAVVVVVTADEHGWSF